MLGSSKPVVFDPYGRRRSRWRPPRWLVLLLGGIAVGVGGVLFVQERYLPSRLSADDSARLRAAYEQANAERQKLKSDLASTGQRLDAALADTARLGTELAGSRDTVERLRGDLAFAVESLPPDPRGGRVEVRAGRFAVKGGALNYDIVLSRDGGGGKPMSGVLQLIVSGDSARGVDTAVSLKPLPISLGAHSTLRGDLPLPEGFRPKQATIQVLDRPAGQPLGMRVMLVK